jgi:hypothetical protein
MQFSRCRCRKRSRYGKGRGWAGYTHGCHCLLKGLSKVLGELQQACDGGSSRSDSRRAGQQFAEGMLATWQVKTVGLVY